MGDFLWAALGHNPSYIWRSIWSSRKLLNEGHRWRIGDGRKIDIWTSPWLRCDEPRISTLTQHQGHLNFVRDLMLVEQSDWNVPLITHCFAARDAAEILKIPLLNTTGLDTIVWRFDKRGIYTGKSGYRVCMERLIESDDLWVAGDWNLIWSMRLPPKVRTFLWRACRDCLPNRINLRRMGVDCSSLCVCFNAMDETNCHTFFHCPVSESCWRKSRLWNIVEASMLQANDFCDLFFQVTKKLDKEDLAHFGMLLWSLWKRRNSKLWDNIDESATQICMRAVEVLKSWIVPRNSPQQPHHTPSATQIPTWRPPPIGWIKCNVDAAIWKETNCIGVGAVLRDETGAFLRARTDWMCATLSALEDEVWGLLQTLKWLNNEGYSNVIMEMDCKQVVDDVLKDATNVSEYGCLLRECKSIIDSNNSMQVVFVKRQANSSTHALAKASTCYANRTIFSDIPHCIWNVIINEMP